MAAAMQTELENKVSLNRYVEVLFLLQGKQTQQPGVAIARLIFTPQLTGSNISWVIGYPDWDFRGYLLYLQRNAWIIGRNVSRLHHFKCLSTRCSRPSHAVEIATLNNLRTNPQSVQAKERQK
jgi:hypothetical protein